jgi:hypothetical protein
MQFQEEGVEEDAMSGNNLSGFPAILRSSFTRFVFRPFYNMHKANHAQKNLDIDIINNDAGVADGAADFRRQETLH